jgi:hypothetical protein
VIAADISTESLDTASLQPMIELADTELQAAGVIGPLGLALADAATGETTRSTRCWGKASRSSSHQTPTGVKNRAPGGAAAAMTSPLGCLRPTRARSCI